MRNKKLFKSAVIITASLFLFTGCGKQAEPVSAEPTETVSEVETEESLESMESTEPAPSPTVETTEEPVEESSSNEESEIDTSEEEESSEEESLESEEPEPDLGYTIIPMDEQVGYIVTNKANVRSGPSTDYDIVDSMTYGESAVFNGYVEQGDSVWYVIKTEDGSIQMVSKGLVSSEKPQPQQSSGNSQPSGGGSSSQPSGGGSSQPSGDGQPQGNTSNDNPYADSSAPGGFFIPGAGENAGAGNDSAIGDGSGAGGLDINWQ